MIHGRATFKAEVLILILCRFIATFPRLRSNGRWGWSGLLVLVNLWWCLVEGYTLVMTMKTTTSWELLVIDVVLILPDAGLRVESAASEVCAGLF